MVWPSQIEQADAQKITAADLASMQRHRRVLIVPYFYYRVRFAQSRRCFAGWRTPDVHAARRPH